MSETPIKLKKKYTTAMAVGKKGRGAYPTKGRRCENNGCQGCKN